MGLAPVAPAEQQFAATDPLVRQTCAYVRPVRCCRDCATDPDGWPSVAFAELVEWHYHRLGGETGAPSWRHAVVNAVLEMVYDRPACAYAYWDATKIDEPMAVLIAASDEEFAAALLRGAARLHAVPSTSLRSVLDRSYSVAPSTLHISYVDPWDDLREHPVSTKYYQRCS